MHLTNLTPNQTQTIEQIAAILIAAFKEHWPDAWPDTETAIGEVRESFGPGRISRVALSDDGTALGWIGGISQYDGLVWELHPSPLTPPSIVRALDSPSSPISKSRSDSAAASP